LCVSDHVHHSNVFSSIILGENRQRYFQRLINGSYTPLTLPVGGEEACEVSPRSLSEALLVKSKHYPITCDINYRKYWNT